MISAGNDIVALKAISRRTSDKKFYSKILSYSEQTLYKQLFAEKIPFDIFVWIIWSVKESVYKFLKRGITDLNFNPIKIIIQHLGIPSEFSAIKWKNNRLEHTDFSDEYFYKSIVVTEQATLHARSTVSDEFISTVVSADAGFSNILWGIKSIDDYTCANQSKEVRTFLLNKLDCVCSEGIFEIKKNNAGFPVIVNKEKELYLPVSFSHHQKFVSYSFYKSFT